MGRTIVHCARVAQRLEHRSCKAGVVGSIPTSGSASFRAPVTTVGSRVNLPSTERLLSMTLSPRDEAILEFESSWWTEPGPKEVAVALQFQLTMAEYTEALGSLIDDQAALEAEPLVVRRLRRARDRRRQDRAGIATAGGGER